MWKVIALLGIVSAAPSDDQIRLDFNPINQFTLQLLDNTFAFQDNFGRSNIAISPLSVWGIFSLLAEASTGETFKELTKGLRLPGDLRSTQALHGAIVNLLHSEDSDVCISEQSTIFADCDLKIHQEFCQSANYYNTGVYLVDAKNTTKLADDINYYICLATHGKIKHAVRAQMLENLRLILVDALYFKASWTNPFDPTQTKEESFYNSQGKTIGTVNMMYHKEKHNVGEYNQIGAQVLELSYGKTQQFSMLLMVPYDGMPLKTMLSNLATQSLDWMADFMSTEYLQEVDVYVPRFKISSQIDLIPPLQYSGIQRIFDVDKAELPGLSDSPLFVSKTIQNVDIEVTEEGTVAAASTVVGLEDRILGQRFEANKEFAFAIIDKKTGLILLSGVYADPKPV
ncbi:serine protease inhibitor-like [Aricia agestis]|uniref:serine protease inhibitor-like n=1 Tax=Aricia agestis TaxID=91739 RepID=UPI001C20831B|nr:serine protease inhibitor-like [Aricia agestis]